HHVDELVNGMCGRLAHVTIVGCLARGIAGGGVWLQWGAADGADGFGKGVDAGLDGWIVAGSVGH
ncbi:hypothetical protein ACLOJK_037315, partial [Asimina triloba]